MKKIFYCLFMFSIVLSLQGSSYLPKATVPITSPSNTETQLATANYYDAPDSFITPRLLCQRTLCKEDELTRYKFVFEDTPTPPSWAVNSHHSLEEVEFSLEFKEFSKLYEKVGSFSDYSIYLNNQKESKNFTLIGIGIVKHVHKSCDRVEVICYIGKNYRNKGYGKELSAGLIEHVIKPALDKPFRVYGTKDTSLISPSDNSFTNLYNLLSHVSIHPECKGVEGLIDLENSASLAISLSAGYSSILLGGAKILVCWPPLHKLCMSISDMNNLKKLSSLWSKLTPSVKKNMHTLLQQDTYTTEQTELKNIYCELLKTEEPFTFATVLSDLKNNLKIDLETLSLSEIEKFIDIRQTIQKMEHFFQFFTDHTCNCSRFLMGPISLYDYKDLTQHFLNHLMTLEGALQKSPPALRNKGKRSHPSSEESSDGHDAKRARHS